MPANNKYNSWQDCIMTAFAPPDSGAPSPPNPPSARSRSCSNTAAIAVDKELAT